MASDRVIIGWEKGLTLQFHKLRSLGLMPFSEDLHGKDQVIASHWPRPELDISLWSFGERSVLRNKRKALKGEPALQHENMKEGNHHHHPPFTKVDDKEGLFLGRKKKRQKKIGKYFSFKDTLAVL